MSRYHKNTETITVYDKDKILTWSDGILYGDDDLKKSAQYYTTKYLYVDFVPTLPLIPANYKDKNHLINVLAALVSFNPETVLIFKPSQRLLNIIDNPLENVQLESYLFNQIASEQ